MKKDKALQKLMDKKAKKEEAEKKRIEALQKFVQFNKPEASESGDDESPSSSEE